ncbi:hypothetical protein CEXT_537351 [Caerostris extrusa]|uniref:Uncharacterized protein n=1 Tax=Caerostris extrusa TaxID=172846 RepID=A0AAV4TPN5_CAEEX|nr:hypothetical protein CEXT_537351 [Caerostris extrusa]
MIVWSILNLSYFVSLLADFKPKLRHPQAWRRQHRIDFLLHLSFLPWVTSNKLELADMYLWWGRLDNHPHLNIKLSLLAAWVLQTFKNTLQS